jgi:hypothetical protein
VFDQLLLDVTAALTSVGDIPNGSSDLSVGSGVRGWWRSGKAVWVLAITAVVSLAAGFALGGLVRSPAELAAESAVPPDGLVTARVEARVITSVVTGRADVVFSDPVEIGPSAPEGAGAPVVTGQVPEVGQVVEAGDVVLEVSGSPVFVLPGMFPAYRSMGPGSSGPDVLQLRTALASLGLSVGDAESKTYDGALADAVRALFENTGYPAPGSEDQARLQAVRDARYQVTDAQDVRDQAVKALAAAEKALKDATDVEAKEQAQQAVDAAKSALAQAERSVERAQEALADAERAAWTTMPLTSVVFVSDLPRRVDQVGVSVGSDLADPGGIDSPTGESSSAAAVVLSGADIEVTASVGLDEAGLLVVGGPAVLGTGAGEVTGEIAEVCPQAGEVSAGGDADGNECEVVITVADPGGVDLETMVGNVLVTMVVGTTSADSLVVPVAAVSADTAGKARIEVVEGELAHDRAAADQPTRIVAIVPGLTAEGMVEIKEADTALKAGDLVVIGRAASGAGEATAVPAARG